MPDGPDSGFPDVAVCMIESLFAQTMVLPDLTVTEEGSYDIPLFGFDAPLTIDTAVCLAVLLLAAGAVALPECVLS